MYLIIECNCIYRDIVIYKCKRILYIELLYSNYDCYINFKSLGSGVRL